jgi:1-deoxy-D-xylulose-5-phosphate reductoisomerase
VKQVVILGATGSIGASALDVAAAMADRIRVVGLACQRDWRALAALTARWRPEAVAVGDATAWREAREARAFDPSVRLLGGPEGMAELAALETADVVLNGIVGAAGLRPTLAALKAGKRVALANKESLVVGGELVMAQARETGRLLPVDSEHSAIWQLLDGRDPAHVARIVLTASGGPFRGVPRERLATVTPEEALAHPTWSMGPKITIDSATLANKGLEIIEAHHLFAMPYDKIDVVIHPQSIVHGLVEAVDGTLFAQLSRPDMRDPIRTALTWPERVPVAHLADVTELGGLTFEPPDLDRFPALALARESGRAGGTAPAVFNAANEVAVAAFLDRRIGFLEIVAICERVLAEHEPAPARTVEDLLAADAWARSRAAGLAHAGTRAARVV